MRLADRPTLAGLVAYALAGWTWIDPAVGFVIAAFALKEGREAWEGSWTTIRTPTRTTDANLITDPMPFGRRDG
jgi:Co/Zn/Cd efflux system component